MAYFDNAATTYPKPKCVYDFMDKFYRECGGNAGRGTYKQAKNAGELIANTRMMIKNLFHFCKMGRLCACSLSCDKLDQ